MATDHCYVGVHGVNGGFPVTEKTEKSVENTEKSPEITEKQRVESVPGGFAAQVTATVRNRGQDYSHPAENHQLTADMWSSWLSRRLGTEILLTPEDVCMLNVLQKASRLAHATKDDGWLDIAGYTENVAMLEPGQRNHQRKTMSDCLQRVIDRLKESHAR